MNWKFDSIKYFLLFTFYFLLTKSYAQVQPVACFKGAIKQNRNNEYQNIINNIIGKGLSLPLTDSTEEDWEDAFQAMESIQYKLPWADSHIHTAFDSIEKRSVEFQQALLELCYADYPNEFKKNITPLLEQTHSEIIFALCAEYLKQADTSSANMAYIKQQVDRHIQDNSFGWPININNTYQPSIFFMVFLSNIFYTPEILQPEKLLPPFFSKDFMKKNVVVYSIQRKDRDFPGIVIVKDTAGNFIKNNDGNIFYVPQLARSISHLPFYFTGGNTPQGIFRMDGFAVSKLIDIGPTENIQLAMPFESCIKYFLKDPTINDSNWTENLYKKVLPETVKYYPPLYQTYFAGKAGRTEIIAHGSTINPEYYKNKPYYPLTPTEGCLCTEEIWSSIDGKRIISDQQLLVNAVKKAGGADGYCIVIDIDDQQKPVDIKEILPFIK